MRLFKLGMSIILLGFLVAAVALLLRPSEPMHADKSLTDWLTQLDDGDYNSSGFGWTDLPAKDAKQQQAAEAIVNIGVEALPHLEEDLLYTEPEHKLLLRRFFEVQSLFPNPLKRRLDRAWQASLAIEVLGTNAMPLLARLETCLYDHERSKGAARALAAMGSDGVDALKNALISSNHFAKLSAVWIIGARKVQDPHVVEPLTRCLFNADQGIRGITAWSLARVKLRPDIVVPALTDALNDPNPANVIAELKALGEFGNEASEAIPKIKMLLNDSNSSVSAAAAGALKKIDVREGTIH